ncbi:MAG TPA: polyphosphate:AMP phosphotransferase [Thermogutta sp.]|nr:polyphosphate:AMP phosphotransferase [Thermogutta sp.]
MLELVDLNQRISGEEYEKIFPDLEAQLAACQRMARQSGIPIAIVFEGWDAAGKGMMINRLAQVLDPRGFRVYLTGDPSAEEQRRPWMWRFWKELPGAGEIVMFDHSWYRRILDDVAQGRLSRKEYQQAVHDILEFEKQLADSGLLLIKFWLHISAKEQRRRLKRLEQSPATRWKVTKSQWEQNRKYKKWQKLVETALQRTSSSQNPWTVVEANQGKFARVKVFRTIISAIKETCARREREPAPSLAPMPEPDESQFYRPTILDRVDLTKSIGREEYERELEVLHKKLYELEHRCYLAKIPVVIVYEGWDAAGKGGTIKRLTRALDPRGYEVVPVGPPTTEEKAHHYLWRFWRRIPKTGHITIFDRSWYGRVLVERVEGYCSQEEWERAYREINEFERQLADFGTVIIKFWLHIDSDEQLRRFERRQSDPQKQWKITEGDWRNRAKRKHYELAVIDMLQRTSTLYAPWTILEANCKLFARIKSLRVVVERLEAATR